MFSKIEKELEERTRSKILYRSPLHNKRHKVESKYIKKNSSGLVSRNYVKRSYLVYTNRNNVYTVYNDSYLMEYIPKDDLNVNIDKLRKPTRDVNSFIKEAKQFINRKRNNGK